MDFFCGENDPNGPFVSEHGVYHLFYQDHVGLPNRNASLPGAGLSWGHAASPNLAQWVYLPMGLWGGEPISDRDCGGLSTGSTTQVNGVPTIVYPGGCHPGDPNAVGVPGGKGAGNAYSAAVPADPADKFAKVWKRIGPLINDTDNDPSEAWQTNHGEWRLIGHGGGGKCPSEGPLNGTDCAPMWATADPGFHDGWYKVGVSGLPGGECQNGPYPLPSLYPGTADSISEAEQAAMPTHVHHTGAKYMLGVWLDGTPGIGDNHTGSWLPASSHFAMRGAGGTSENAVSRAGHGDGGASRRRQGQGPPFVQFLEDHGQYYASKGFTDDQSSRKRAKSSWAPTMVGKTTTHPQGQPRRIIYGWNKSPPASQTLPRVVTYHPQIKRLVFSPAPELELLRKPVPLPTLPNHTTLKPNVSTPVAQAAHSVGVGVKEIGWGPGQGLVSEVRVRWQRPTFPARLSLTVMMDSTGSGGHTIGMDYRPPPQAAMPDLGSIHEHNTASSSSGGSHNSYTSHNSSSNQNATTRMYNVSVDGTCDTGRGANAYSCEGLWLLPTDDAIELTVYVDNTVAELCAFTCPHDAFV